jgi:hypothetical protein
MFFHQILTPEDARHIMFRTPITVTLTATRWSCFVALLWAHDFVTLHSISWPRRTMSGSSTQIDLALVEVNLWILENVYRSGLVGGRRYVQFRFILLTLVEMVPALLAHLNIAHISLASHSGGNIYLVNTMLTHPCLLHPETPYVCFFAPWVVRLCQCTQPYSLDLQSHKSVLCTRIWLTSSLTLAPFPF